MSQRLLAFLFRLPHQSFISKMIRNVTQEMTTRFIPQNIGLQHISRDDLMKFHMRPSYAKVLGLPATAFVAILDGTFLFIEVTQINKSSKILKHF